MQRGYSLKRKISPLSKMWQHVTIKNQPLYIMLPGNTNWKRELPFSVDMPQCSMRNGEGVARWKKKYLKCATPFLTQFMKENIFEMHYPFFNAFIPWSITTKLWLLQPLTCGIPRPSQTQATMCGPPSNSTRPILSRVTPPSTKLAQHCLTSIIKYLVIFKRFSLAGRTFFSRMGKCF
jgi:hypothetical protein